MDISTSIRRHQPTQLVSDSGKPTPEPMSPGPRGIGDYFTDGVVTAKFLLLGQIYKTLKNRKADQNEKQPPLASLPPVKLERPFVMVPGWTTTRVSFDPLAEKLLESGQNGKKFYFVRNGEFFADRECLIEVPTAQVKSGEAKVFEVVFSTTRLQPSKSHKELAENLSAVKTVTKAENLDVSAYSMGGLSARNYLDTGGKDINKLMMLGTANRGAEFAKWAKRILERDIRWAVNLGGLVPADIPALTELSPEEGNPYLQDLNTRWAQQKSQVNEVLVVAGKGTPTGSSGWNPVTSGDGLVSVERATPLGEEVTVLEGQHHSHLNNSPEVYETMTDFFGWEKHSEK